MELIINSRGAFLRKKDSNFEISTDERKTEVSPKKISSILISTSACVTTDALMLAVENNIQIVMLDYSGQPFARVWHCRPGSTNKIRRLQLNLDKSAAGIELAKGWLIEKFKGRLDLIRQLKKRREGMDEIFDSSISDLQEACEKITAIRGNACDKRGDIMGCEGRSGRSYFEALSYVMPTKYKFSGRSKHPAKDPFNAMLNYAYGVLYGKVEGACIIAGLDPYVGILHTDSYNKLSLVYDVIEMFRPWAEETVVFLFTGRKVKEEFFRDTKDGVLLDKPGKEVLIQALNDMFEKIERFHGRNQKRGNIILAECHRSANVILKEAKD